MLINRYLIRKYKNLDYVVSSATLTAFSFGVRNMSNIEECVKYLVDREKSRELNCAYTVSTWADIWFDSFKKQNLRDSSIDKYKRTIKHIKALFGDMLIANLDVLECQQKFNSIDKPSVKDDCCALLNEMLIKAVKCRYIDFNVMDAIEYKKHKKKKGQAFTREQEERFVQACQSNYRGVALLVALYCGLRRGELLGLTTDDIHLEERYISINKQFQNGKIVPPKTDSGIRNVPILDNLYPYLKDMDLSKHERLFPIKEHALREHFQNALKASGLYGQGFTLHSLRHTFITRCAENKVSSAVAQKWAGHSSADMTQNVYTHVNEDFEKEEIAKFNKGVNDTYNQEKKTIRE